MFYVCVICMVSDKRGPLMELTGELRQIWERMIRLSQPRLKIKKLSLSTLLVCMDCQRLIETIHKFQHTMTLGANYLLSLHSAAEYQERKQSKLKKKVLIHPLPQMINQSDLWLPVANEEVVVSTETCDDIESAKPVATNACTTNLPLILHRPSTLEKLSCQHVPETINVALMGRNDANMQTRAPLLKVPPTERSDATTQIRASLIKGPHATERNDLRIKIRASLLQEPHANQLKDAMNQIRAPPSKGSQVRGAINQSDALALPEPAQCIRPAMLIAYKEKSNLLCEEDVAYSSEFSETSKIEEATPTPKDSKEETTNVSGLSEGKIKLNRQLFDALKATLQASLTEEFGTKYEPEPETGCESRPELGRKLEPELQRESGPELGPEPDFGRDSDDPDSDSTLSCQSDYEDPEYCPNIIFARAFDGVYGVSYDPRIIGKGLDREGKAQDVQIHSHIVTNPPSEWPCTWESCQLQDLDDEDEASESPTNGPPNEQVTRSKRKGHTRRFKCKLCGKSFTQTRILWKHYEREHVEPVKCNTCRKEFRNETELKFHKIKHQIKVTAEFEEYASHPCAECGMRFRGPLALRQHLLTRRHAARALWRFQCDMCKRKFPDKKRITGHIQIEHLAKEAVKCPMCPATFKSARSLRRHATAHILAQAQENMHLITQANGHARKRRRTTHTNGKVMQRNGCEDTNDTNRLTNSEEHINMANGRRKRPRKTTHTKAKAYTKRKRQINTHTDINVQVKRTDKQTNRQGKTDKNTQIRKYSNKQDNTYTLNGQESTKDQTHLNGQRNTHTHIQNGQINTDKTTRNARGPTHTNTCTENGQINTDKITRNAKGPTHTNTYKENAQINTEKITRNARGPTHTNTYTDIQNAQINTDKITRNARGPTHTNTYKENAQINTEKITRNARGPTHTNTYTDIQNAQINTDKITRNARGPTHTNTYTDIQNAQINTDKITRNARGPTHTNTYTDIQNGQINTDKITHNAKGPTHTNTYTENAQINTESHKIPRAKGRVRKRRRKCPYTKRKRACTKPPAQEPAVPKTSLFDMLSSFIL